MKKYLSVICVIFLLSCLNDNQVVYPYANRIDNLRDNLDKSVIGIFQAYMDAIEEERIHPTKEATLFVAEIADRMNDQLKNTYVSGKFEEACALAESLETIGFVKPAYTTLEAYTSYLENVHDTIDKFSLDQITHRMIGKKLLDTETVFNLLKGYFEAKSSGLFLHYFNVYSQTFPDLTTKHPELFKYREILETTKNLDFETMMKSVVTVYLDKGMKIERGFGIQDKAIGTGFFIDDKGHILTNHHVVGENVDPTYKGFTKITVAMRDDPDTEIPAKVVGYDKVHDVALLKVEKYSGDHLPLGRSYNMRTGDKIYTIGNPIGLKYTVTSGIISNKEINFFQMGRAFQVDAAINPGNSGGPLIDERGQVIGIVFAGVPQFQGISFAIPFEWVRKSIPSLYRGGQIKRSWIGAALYESRDTKDLSFYYVMPGSGADKGGIKVDDKLISIDGQKIKTLEEAQSVVSFLPYPSLIQVEVERDGAVLKMTVKVDERPYIPVEKTFLKDKQANLINLVFGLKMTPLSKMFGARSYKVDKIYKGLTAYNLDISEGDPVMIYGLKYLEKEKMVVMQIRYLDKDISNVERMFTIQISAEINTII